MTNHGLFPSSFQLFSAPAPYQLTLAQGSWHSGLPRTWAGMLPWLRMPPEGMCGNCIQVTCGLASQGPVEDTWVPLLGSQGISQAGPPWDLPGLRWNSPANGGLAESMPC